MFGELLELPNIRELKGDEMNGKAYALLELFAYGTLETYNRALPLSLAIVPGSTADQIESIDSFSALSPAHLTKLRHLTLVSVALSKRVSYKGYGCHSSSPVDPLRHTVDFPRHWIDKGARRLDNRRHICRSTQREDASPRKSTAR